MIKSKKTKGGPHEFSQGGPKEFLDYRSNGSYGGSDYEDNYKSRMSNKNIMKVNYDIKKIYKKRNTNTDYKKNNNEDMFHNINKMQFFDFKIPKKKKKNFKKKKKISKKKISKKKFFIEKKIYDERPLTNYKKKNNKRNFGEKKHSRNKISNGNFNSLRNFNGGGGTGKGGIGENELMRIKILQDLTLKGLLPDLNEINNYLG